MLRIGIVGSDNSHAIAFSELVNKPFRDTGTRRYPEAQVTCLYGLEKARNLEVAEKGEIPYIAPTPEDMLGRVDAVMIVFRHGDLHLKYAKPFIDAGIPVWVDKPFCKSSADARTLIELCRKKNVCLTGGSTVKYIPDVAKIKSLCENPPQNIGRVHSVTLGFMADPESEYGGLCFYGSHLAEVMMAALGYEPRSVCATQAGRSISAVVNYDDIQVTLNFGPDIHTYYASVYGTSGIESWTMNISDCYVDGFDAFYAAVRGGGSENSLQDGMIYNPVRLIEAILESAAAKKEINLNI